MNEVLSLKSYEFNLYSIFWNKKQWWELLQQDRIYNQITLFGDIIIVSFPRIYYLWKFS